MTAVLVGSFPSASEQLLIWTQCGRFMSTLVLAGTGEIHLANLSDAAQR